MEKCSTLFSSDRSIPDDEHLTMTHYINGLRIRKWKPNENEIDERRNELNIDLQDKNKDYCYLYNDKLNETQDYVFNSNSSETNTCSKNNPIFQSPLVTNVFESEYLDKAHQMPIKKCVFEIDKSKMEDVSVVTDFWNKWKTHDCFSIQNGLRDQLYDYEKREKALRFNLGNIRSEFITASNNFTLYKNELFTCKMQKDRLNRELQLTQEAYDKALEKSGRLEVDINNDKEKLHELQINVAKLEQNILNKKEKINIRTQQLELCNTESMPTCERNRVDIKRQTEFFEQDIARLEDDIARTKDIIGDRWNQYVKRKEELEICQNEMKRLQSELARLTELYNEKSSLNATCQEERKQFEEDYEKNKESYHTSSNIFFECENEREILKDRVENCSSNLSICVNDVKNLNPYDENGEWVNVFDEDRNAIVVDVNSNNVSSHFDRIDDTIVKMSSDHVLVSGQYSACMVRNAELRTHIDNLQENKKEYQRELNALETRKRQLDDNIAQTSIDSLKSQNHQMLATALNISEQQILDSLRNKCASDAQNLDFEFNKASQEEQILNEEIRQLSREENTCKDDCDITVTQCMIHKEHPAICGALLHEEENPVHVTIDIFDQTNAKVQTIMLTEMGQTERVMISGSIELKYFEYHNDNESNIGVTFRAVSGITHGSNPQQVIRNMCPENFDKNQPHLVDYIDPSTTYRRVYLYRGITCVTFIAGRR